MSTEHLAIFSTCPQSRDISSEEYAQRVIETARWSETAGCEGMLVYTDNGIVDPWLVSQLILQNTQRLAPLRCYPRTSAARSTGSCSSKDSLRNRAMAEEEIVSRIKSIFEQSLNLRAPAPEIDIIESALLDSLVLVTLLLGIEQEFDMEIPLESLEIEDFRTIESIAQLIERAAVSS